MKVLVTGAAGFIGSRVVKQLAADPNVETIALVRALSNLWRLKACGLEPQSGNPILASVDLCDRAAVDQVLRTVRPDVLIHLAMAYNPLGSTGGKDVNDVNLHATLNLQHAFSASGGRRFVGAGTCFEYGHQEVDLIEEAAPCRPIYDYAIAKARATEALLDHGQKHNMETLVLRVFAPYGPLEEKNRIVPQMLEAGRTGRSLDLSPGEQYRDYVYVEDVASAFVAAALRPLSTAQAIYNVSSAMGHSLRDLAAAVSRVLGQTLNLHWGKLPYRPNEMMRLVGNNQRIRRELGWPPACSLQDGLMRTEHGMVASNSAA